MAAIGSIMQVGGFGGGGGGGGGGTPTGTPNTFSFFNNSGNLATLTGWGTLTDTNGSNVFLTYEPNNLSVGYTLHNFTANVDPLQNSPNDSFNHFNLTTNIDPNKTGLNIGSTSGNITPFNSYFQFHGNGNTCAPVTMINTSASVGDGTDPVTLRGANILYGGFTVNANATLDGGVGGFTFGLSVNAAAVTTANTYVNAFNDAANAAVEIKSYQSFNASPTVSAIANNSGMISFNANPTVTNFNGNANYIGLLLGGTFTTFNTGNYQGVIVTPTISTLSTNSTGIYIGPTTTAGTADWTAINIDSQNITTTGTIYGIQATVPTTDNSNLAINASGRCNLSADFEIIDGLVQQYGHVIGGSVAIPDGVTISATDILGNNLAMTVDTGNATSVFNPSSLVSITTLGFVGQIIGDGTVNGDVIFCLNGYSAAHNGNIDRVVNFSAAAIPGGGTGTIGESVLFLGQQPYGLVATDNWGVRIDTPTLENYLPTLAIGDMASKKVANASALLDLDSTTKTLILPRMTPAQEAAIATPVDGMLLYDATNDNFRGYINGAWTSLSTGGGAGVQIDEFTYDFAVNGGAQGTITLGTVANDRMVVAAHVVTVTTLASATNGAQVEFFIAGESPFGGNPPGNYDSTTVIQYGAVTEYKITGGNGDVTIDITLEDLTAGECRVLVQSVPFTP